MIDLKDTVYNVSTIHKRMGKKAPKKTTLHLFARGLYKALTPDDLFSLEAVIENDYKAAKAVIVKARQELKQLTKSKS